MINNIDNTNKIEIVDALQSIDERLATALKKLTIREENVQLSEYASSLELENESSDYMDEQELFKNRRENTYVKYIMCTFYDICSDSGIAQREDTPLDIASGIM